MTQYKRWLERLDQLRRSDAGLSVFGASAHRYHLNPPLTEAELVAFERKHQVTLPQDYRDFLQFCGNGGAGPHYGVFPLGMFDGAGSQLEPWTPGDGFAGILSEPFPHSSAWNLPPERFVCPEDFESDAAEEAWLDTLDNECWSAPLTNGAFPICHQALSANMPETVQPIPITEQGVYVGGHGNKIKNRWYINHPGHAAQRRGGCQASAAKFHGSLQASGA